MCKSCYPGTYRSKSQSGLSLILCKHQEAGVKTKVDQGGGPGNPVRRLDCRQPEILQPVKGSGASAVHIPLTGKGFLLSGHPICIIDFHLGVVDAPVLPSPGPFLCNVHHGEIQHFHQTVIRRKNGLGFCNFAKLAVNALNGIGRVDQPANLFREFEICAQVCSILPPGSSDPGIFLSPMHLQTHPGRFVPTAHPLRHKRP